MALSSIFAAFAGAHDAAAVSIRYACRCGHYAPIRSMFYSELCQKLVCRRPTCSVEEFESFYCSYLLVNLPSKEASAYQNRSSRCFACVACGNVLSTVYHDVRAKYFFACSHCHWDSLDVELLEDDPDMLLMTAVAREREVVHEDVFHALSSFHVTSAAMASSAANMAAMNPATRAYGRRGSRTSSLQSLATSMKEMQREQHMKKFRLQRMAEMGSFKYDHALLQMEQREQYLHDQRHEHEWPPLKQQLEQIHGTEVPTEEENRSLEAVAASGDMGEIATLAQRLLLPLDQPRASHLLMPHRPLLRVKRTWRCIESLARGSAGILVKPQISPMSGDSSLPVPAAWFKKATLGVHFVPIVTFQKLPRMADDAGVPCRVDCVLLIENPLDDAVQIVCQAGDASEHHAKVLLEDATPIVIGAYEDPTIAEAFAGDDHRITTTNSGNDSTSTSSGSSPRAPRRNQHLVSSQRNLIKLHVPLEISSASSSSCSSRQVAFRLQMETIRIDETLQEPVLDSLSSFTIELQAPVA